MNRQELAEELSARTNLAPAVARAALEALFGTSRESGIIAAKLRDGTRVQLAGFGTFELRERGARSGFDPRTRTRIVIPAGRAPASSRSRRGSVTTLSWPGSLPLRWLASCCAL